ncbi:hypothetical protein SUGI_0447810 [Cryptomeria japonica]|nr:hypothetical protein SUGI_0447810 [Cryptomeria japonica]
MVGEERLYDFLIPALYLEFAVSIWWKENACRASIFRILITLAISSGAIYLISVDAFTGWKENACHASIFRILITLAISSGAIYLISVDGFTDDFWNLLDCKCLNSTILDNWQPIKKFNYERIKRIL